jgi:hypothetical protein
VCGLSLYSLYFYNSVSAKPKFIVASSGSRRVKRIGSENRGIEIIGAYVKHNSVNHQNMKINYS